ncbi:MAG: esterase, partial [Burkholderiales bacterium]|nr:esterase [Burkholderiales bacterium]
MSTIVYLHGFRSSPASIKATRLRAYVDALPASARPVLHIPELTHAPAEAVRGVAAWVEANARDSKVMFVGSSLGGFYATHLAERFGARAVMINPAVHPQRDLAPWIGVQTNLYTG